MAKLSASYKNFNKPAPKGFARFENAYILIIAPALTAAIQGWGLTDETANKLMVLVGFSVAVVKAVGLILCEHSPEDKNCTHE